MKKFGIKLLSLVLGFAMVNMNNTFISYGAELSNTDVTLNVGDVTTISVFGDSQGYWTSDKPDVASVENGVIRGLSAGDAVVSFIEYGDIKSDVRVSVIDSKVIKQFDNYSITNNAVKENELKPGKYVIKAERGKFGTYTISQVSENIGFMESRSIITNTIVSLEDGYNVKLDGCLLYSLESIKLNTSSSGGFVVGQHIPAGVYVIETDNCDVGQYILYTDTDKNEISESYNIKQDTPYSIRLYEGEYIELNGLKLVG